MRHPARLRCRAPTPRRPRTKRRAARLEHRNARLPVQNLLRLLADRRLVGVSKKGLRLVQKDARRRGIRRHRLDAGVVHRQSWSGSPTRTMCGSAKSLSRNASPSARRRANSPGENAVTSTRRPPRRPISLTLRRSRVMSGSPTARTSRSLPAPASPRAHEPWITAASTPSSPPKKLRRSFSTPTVRSNSSRRGRWRGLSEFARNRCGRLLASRSSRRALLTVGPCRLGQAKRRRSARPPASRAKPASASTSASPPVAGSSRVTPATTGPP